jgi:hypothetical protein
MSCVKANEKRRDRLEIGPLPPVNTEVKPL